MWKYILFVVTFRTLGRLPLPALYAIAGLVAAISYYVASAARGNVLDNLRHVMPATTPKRDLRRAARQIFGNVVLYYADLASMPHMDVDHFFRRRLVFHGLDEHLRPAIAEGKGVVIFGAHFGNPELAVQGLIPLGIPVFALTEPQHPRLSRFLDEIRASKGHQFGAVNVGNVKRVFQTLKRGGVVALMGDRDIRGPKAVLPFCGVETLMPTGPVEVALRTGAAVIPCFSIRKSKYVIEAFIEEPLALGRTGDFERDVESGTLRYLERFERRLRADPGQWAVLEAIWDAPASVEKAPAVVRGDTGRGQ